MAERAGFHRFGLRALILFLFALCLTPLGADAEEPLHVRIDRTIERGSFGSLSPLASDSDFLRRVYLDLAGVIPAADEARAFLSDDSPHKRAAIIDRLLGSRRYVRHMADVFDVILMERRNGKHVKADEWLAYLRDSLARNKPWNQIARELLAADGTDTKIRPAAKFYLDREGETNAVTRDVGRVFFGMDLQCCQCHDHPIIDHYYQADYYGIFAFLNRGFLFTGKDKKVLYAEKAEGDVAFTSVFTDEKGQTRPRLPGGLEITEPVFEVGGEYEVKPVGKKRPIPRYSRRSQLAELATSGGNRAFNRNIVNRLWAHMMGQGLVSPLDLQHADNPPAHPDLLDVLAEDFVSKGYDIKAFLRELALTKTYQRSLEAPAAFDPQSAPAADQLAQFELRYEERKQVKGRILAEFQEAEKRFNEARHNANQIYAEFKKAGTVVAAALKKSDEAAKKLAAAKKQLAAKQDIAKSLGEAAAKALAAAEKLANDPELTQAAGIFQSRAEKLTSEVATAQKPVQDASLEFDKTQEVVAEARAGAAPIQNRLEQANNRIGGLRGPLVAIGQKLDPAEVAVLDAKVQLDNAKILVGHAQLVASDELAQTAYQVCLTDLQAAGPKLEETVKALASHETRLVDARREHDEATRSLKQSEEQLAARVTVAKLVDEAAASAEAASKKLPKEAQLKQAFQTVKKRADQVQTEVAQLKDAAGQRHQEAEIVGARLAAARQAVRSAQETITKVRRQQADLTALLPDLESRAKQARLAREQSSGALNRHLSRRFCSVSLEALTPEQMAWSAMQATGVLEKQRQAAVGAVDKKLPLDDKNPKDPKRLAERERAVEAFIYDKLKGNVRAFVKLFGHAAGQPQSDFFATVDQALFFANAGTLQSWLSPSGGSLTDRLNKFDDPNEIAEELYISVLTRRPSKEETADVAQYLADRPAEKRVDALKEMAWALLTSAEFRFSH